MSLKVGELFGSLNLDDGPFQRTLRAAGGGLVGMTKAAGVAAKASGVALAVSAGVAAVAIGKIGMGYQDSLNVFRAVSGANADQMRMVADRAKELGNDLTLPGVSAAGAAAAMTEMAKAGLSVEQSMAAAKGVLQLAKAATVDEATAAQMTAAALNAFSLSGDQAVRVADLLAAAANSSMGEITDMGFAMSQSAPIFASAGVSIEDLTASIAMLANKGIHGSDAGTSLKTMLMSLQAPTGAAKDALDGLGVSIFNTDGSMRGYRDIVAGMSSALAPLTDAQRAQAIETIFGSDAARAANIIFGQGVEAFDASREAVTKQGAAAEVAGAKAQGLSGAIEGVKSQLETMAISIYDEVSPALETLVRGFGSSVEGASNWASDIGGKLGFAASMMNDSGMSFQDSVRVAFGADSAVTAFANKLVEVRDKLLEVWNNPAVQSAISMFKGQMEAAGENFRTAFQSAKPMLDALMPILKNIGLVLGGIILAAIVAVGFAFRIFSAVVENFAPKAVFIVSIIGAIASVFRAFAVWLISAGVGAWTAISSAVGAAIGFIVGVVSGMVGAVSGAIGAVIDAFWSMVGAVSGAVGSLIGTVSGIPGQILSALGNVGSLLYESGKSIIQGLIDGIAGMGSALWDGVSNLVSENIPGPVKSILGISSPSRLMMQYGRWTAEGLALGIAGGAGAVTDAVSGLTSRIRLSPSIAGSAAFAGGGASGGQTSSSGASSNIEVALIIDPAMSWLEDFVQVKIKENGRDAFTSGKSNLTSYRIRPR